MENVISIYCDESNPNQNDGQDFMVLGAIIIERKFYKKTLRKIQNVKRANNLTLDYEFKWQRVSEKYFNAYKELIDLIANDDKIKIKINLALGKKLLVFDKNSTYDQWYHKMYYYMFKNFIDYHKTLCDNQNFELLIDKKDTHSAKNYKRVAANLNLHFRKSKAKHFFSSQECNSREFVLIQAIDVILGAVSYFQRKNFVNKPKTNLMKYIQNKLQISFDIVTPKNSDKVSFFIWHPKTNG